MRAPNLGLLFGSRRMCLTGFGLRSTRSGYMQILKLEGIKKRPVDGW